MSAQDENGARAQDFEFALEIWAAIREFGWQRLVCRRSTAKRGRHVGIFQLEAVIAIRRARLIGETGAMHCLVKKIARAIASEHPAGAICAVRSGREPKNQQLRVRISKARNRLAPIFPFAICETLFAGDFLAVAHQARARAAVDNLFIQLAEGVQNGLAWGENVVQAPLKMCVE